MLLHIKMQECIVFSKTFRQKIITLTSPKYYACAI